MAFPAGLAKLMAGFKLGTAGESGFGSPNLPAIRTPAQEVAPLQAPVSYGNMSLDPGSAAGNLGEYSPLESMMNIFEEIRDGINKLVTDSQKSLNFETKENQKGLLVDTDEDGEGEDDDEDALDEICPDRRLQTTE